MAWAAGAIPLLTWAAARGLGRVRGAVERLRETLRWCGPVASRDGTPVCPLKNDGMLSGCDGSQAPKAALPIRGGVEVRDAPSSTTLALCGRNRGSIR
jgi:hypothetical protein